MSVGGVIIDVVEVDPHKWWVNTIQSYDWKLHLTPEQLAKRAVAVYCDPNGERPAVGDVLWWQSGTCYWTPADRSRTDVKLRKIGFSGVRHPDRPTWESEQAGADPQG